MWVPGPDVVTVAWTAITRRPGDARATDRHIPSRCGAALMSGRKNAAPARSTRTGSGCSIDPSRKTRPNSGRSSLGSKHTGCEVAYLPGLAMREAAQLLPGDAKTDARDAFVIAMTALRMPGMLRLGDRDCEILASLKVLAGYDDDPARESTRSINRLRSLLLQIHPRWSVWSLVPGSPIRSRSTC